MSLTMMNIVNFLLLTLVCGCVATDPGVKVRVTKRGIDFANTVAHKQIVQQLQTLVIPDQSGSGHHTTYEIKSIKVKRVTLPGSSIVLVPAKSGLTWSLSNFGISLTADWHVWYKKGIIKFSDHGSVDVGLSGVNVAETTSFGIDKTGRPSIFSSGCSDSVGGVDVKFHGGSAFILNLFSGDFEYRIKKLLNDKICDQVEQLINQDAEQSLATSKISMEIAQKFLLDYRLLAAPSVLEEYLEILSNGAIYWEADPTESPFVPAPIPPLTDKIRMIYIWVTAYTPNTFFYQAHNHGYLRYNVTKKDLPPDSASYLNTTCSVTCIGKLIPQIGKAYPNSTVEVRARTASVPMTNATRKAVKIQADVLVELWARTPQNKLAFLLTIGVNTSLTLNLSIANERLTGQITDYRSQLAVIKSAVGTINPILLKVVFQGIMTDVVVEELNKIAEKGVDLPIIQGVQFANTTLSHQQGYILIGTDLAYNERAPLYFNSGQFHVFPQ